MHKVVSNGSESWKKYDDSSQKEDSTSEHECHMHSAPNSPGRLQHATNLLFSCKDGIIAEDSMLPMVLVWYLTR